MLFGYSSYVINCRLHVFTVHSSCTHDTCQEESVKFMDLAAPARVCSESIVRVVRRRDSVRKKASRPKAGERKRTSRRQQNVPLRNPGDRLTRHHRRRQAEQIRSCEPRQYGVPLHRVSIEEYYFETCSIRI